jgi:hypothetical protein
VNVGAMHSAQRTLVKSPPELWAEISDPAALARRFEGFGEVRIARLEPETTVAWEGDRARGTVRLEPAGWGTKVTLTAELDEPPAPPEAVPEPEPEPEPELEPAAVAELEPLAPERRRLLARLRSRWRRPPVAETPGPVPDPVPPPPDPAPPGPDPAPDPAPPQIAMDPADTVAALEAVLDDLGAAHHRPFSRA